MAKKTMSKIFSPLFKLVPNKQSILNCIKNNPDITEQGTKAIFMGKKTFNTPIITIIIGKNI